MKKKILTKKDSGLDFEKDLTKKRSHFTISKLIPNIITITSLCVGLTSIRFTFIQEWEKAITCIVISAILDGLDGRIARLLNASSSFGEQLDSLADSLNFGVAPGILLYLWALNEIKIFGWASVMLFVTCMTLRLARFNAKISNPNPKPEWHKKFFSGVPAPLGALLVICPVALSFKEIDAVENFLNPAIICIYVSIISILAISTIPTISIKKIKIPRKFVPLFLGCLASIIISAITKPWIAIPIFCLCYFITIPITACYYCYLVNKKNN